MLLLFSFHLVTRTRKQPNQRHQFDNTTAHNATKLCFWLWCFLLKQLYWFLLQLKSFLSVQHPSIADFSGAGEPQSDFGLVTDLVNEKQNESWEYFNSRQMLTASTDFESFWRPFENLYFSWICPWRQIQEFNRRADAVPNPYYYFY